MTFRHPRSAWSVRSFFKLQGGALFEYSTHHDMSEQINLRIPTGLLEEIDTMADAVGESRSEFLRTAAAERMGYLRCKQDDEAAEEDE